MSQTLYRKYRPLAFGEVVGQEQVKTALQNQILKSTIAHAYLFAGPRGLGKTTIARILARALNCTKRDPESFEPCNACDICQAIINNHSLDVVEIDAASNRGINEIRSLKEHIGFTPSGSSYRVFIIDEVHMLTTEAFNALLKTLEEPPRHALFILATTEWHKLPPTIISRCQTYRFRKVPSSDMIERLTTIAKKEGMSVPKEIMSTIARQSGGFMRDAESLLGQILSLGDKEVTQELASLVLSPTNDQAVDQFIAHLMERDIHAVLDDIQVVGEDGGEIERFTQDVLEKLRTLVLAKFEAPSSTQEEVSDKSSEYSIKDLVDASRALSTAHQEMKRADIAEFPLELAVIELIEAPKVQLQEQGQELTKTQIHHKKEGGEESNGGTTPHTEQNEKPQEKSETKQVSPIKVTIDDIKQSWQKVIATCRNHNHSLALLLRVISPFNISGNILRLGTTYDFHLKRLQEPKNRNTIEKVLEEVFGGTLEVNIERISEDEAVSLGLEAQKQKDKEDETFVKNVLQTFGGQLVSD